MFLDDNPIECAEVQANCPEILALHLPAGDVVESFLAHLWVFDRLKITAEDQQRTELYRQNAERTRILRQAPSFQDFLAALEIEIGIAAPAPQQIARVAQLTQRTNQFNFTTIRRSDGEIRQLPESGRECRTITVRDRFGDYGLVGVMIFQATSDSVDIDTMLLSCRVLGRGVEHRMLRELGEIARERGLATVTATLIPTAKNLPARQFLERVAAPFRSELDDKLVFRVPAETAARLVPHGEEATYETADDAVAGKRPDEAQPALRYVPPYERIARELSTPEQVLSELDQLAGQKRRRPDLPEAFKPAGTETERRLCLIWERLLRFDRVGVNDDYFNLGGTSLQAVDLFAQIDHDLGVRLPLTALIEAPTIRKLTTVIDGNSVRDSLVAIRPGGDRPAIFLVHDGDGETMLYRNLALRLSPDHPVYGLQPHGDAQHPILHTRLEDMAEHHIAKMRSVQPQGPYFVGGMCAGGVIAYEIARRLQAQGETVGMVALIDAADPAAELVPWRFASQRMHSFKKVLGAGGSRGGLLRVAEIGVKATRKAKNLLSYLVSKRLGDAWAKLRMKLFRHYLDRGLPLPPFLTHLPVRTVYLFAEQDYRPSGRFDGELVLFRATTGEGNDEPYKSRYCDAVFGWGPRATRGVRAFDVPGGHSSMLQEPNVRVLADQMQTIIDEALMPGELSQQPAAAVAVS